MDMKSIVKGVGIGMAVGGAGAYMKGMMAGSGMKRSARKSMNKAMKSIEGFVGDMKYMFK